MAQLSTEQQRADGPGEAGERATGSPAAAGQDAASRFRKLAGTTYELTQLGSTQELLEYLARNAAELTDGERSSIFVTDPAHGAMLSRVALGESAPLSIPVRTGIAGHVQATGEPLIVDDAYSDPRFNHEVDGRTGYRTRNLVCVPIRHLSKPPVGVFEVLNKRSGNFDATDVELLLAFGAHAAAALEAAANRAERDAFVASLLDAQRELEGRIAQLDMLHEIEMALQADEELDDLLKTVLEQLANVFDCEAGSFFSPSARADRLYIYLAWGPAAEKLRHVSLEPGEGVASWVYREGETALVNEPAGDSRFSRRVEQMVGFITRNILCVPVSCEGRKLGAIELINHRKRPFSRGDVQGAELIARNIGSVLSRRQQKEGRKRKEALHTLGMLVQAIAHDLRAPLSNVQTGCKYLGDRELPEPKARQFLSMMDRQIQRCLGLVGDILDFARDALVYTFEDLTAGPLFEDLREVVGRDLEARGVALVLEADPAITFRADRARLGRVFINLVLNSARVLGHSGTIRITCSRHGPDVLLAAEDDGPGVPEHLRDTLFEPFVSGSGSSGLGLAISRKIVESHSGRIWLDESFQRGARFVVQLPASRGS